MTPILIECHTRSHEKVILQALEKAEEMVGKVCMICVDDGTDLRKGVDEFCKKSGSKKVLDVIHKVGTFLKAIFERDTEWQSFCSQATGAKSRMQQTQAAHLAPPSQRSKCRFLNIEVLVNWAVSALEVLRGPEGEDRLLLEEHCAWLFSYASLIERLRQLADVGSHVRDYVRKNGLRRTSGSEMRILLEKISRFFPFDFSSCQFKGQIMDFFDEQSQLVPEGEIWVGSSEIIESVFGKLKSLERDQSKGGFTSLLLGAAACVGQTDVSIVRSAMEQISDADVRLWVKEQLGTTLSAKRRRAFGKKAGGTISNKVVQDLAEKHLCKAVGF